MQIQEPEPEQRQAGSRVSGDILATISTRERSTRSQLTVQGDHMSDRPEKMPLIVNKLLAANGRARHDARLLLRQSLRHGAIGVDEHAHKQPGDHQDYADQRDPHDGQGRGIEAGIRRDGGEGVPEA